MKRSSMRQVSLSNEEYVCSIYRRQTLYVLKVSNVALRRCLSNGSCGVAHETTYTVKVRINYICTRQRLPKQYTSFSFVLEQK